jgi:putative transposase
VITYNIPILTQNQEDSDKIIEILEMERYVWNEASAYIFKSGNRGIKFVHPAIYRKTRNERPDIPSQVVIRGCRAAIAAYRGVKSNKHCINETCLKTNLSIRLDKRLYAWKRGKLRVTTSSGRIDVSLQLFDKVKELLSQFPTTDPLIFCRNNRLFLALTFRNDLLSGIEESTCIGVDMGVKNFLATSDGRLYKSPTFLEKKRQIRFLKSNLQRRGTKSARRHLKKVRNRERNFTKNFAHQLANEFLKNTFSKTIVFEDLKGLKSKTSKKNKKKGSFGKFVNNKVSQIPISLFREIISYKAQSKGISVVLVNPAFTSQIDYRTKKTSGIRNKGCYVGKDGVLLNADLNAACNIAERAKIPHFCNENTILETITGQAAVNRLIVCKSDAKAKAEQALCFKLGVVDF